jgi:ATP-binding cassette subfamily F protein uup
MQYLRLENVSKSYGEKILFEDINLTISKGDKVALIAKNGSGKSTLLRVIQGTEPAEGERASVWRSDDIKSFFLEQDPDLIPGESIMEFMLRVDNEKVRLLRDYKSLKEKNDESSGQEILNRMDDLGAWDVEANIYEVLAKLHLPEPETSTDLLSGGQRKRLALAGMILMEADLLILDEPTNHLDLDIIEWLEEYFSNPDLTILMVTHDRYFLERVCNEMLELDQGKLYAYRGSYSDFLEKKMMRLQNEAVVKEKYEQLYKKELDWIRRQPKARGTKAKSRIDKFDEIKKEAKKTREEEEIKIIMKTSRIGGKILEAHAISKSFDDLKILDQFSYKFKKGERLGIVGPNGVGKTTFIKILMGLERVDAGKMIKGETIKFGYYSQDGLVLENDMRVIDVVREVAEYIPLDKGKKLTAEQLLERFLFPRPQQQVYVSQLSGGEKRRLHLLTVLMANPNFLILDEPTNDLDVITLNVLENYLMEFPGCLLIISHDRFLLDKLVDHLFIMQGNGMIKDYNGRYSEYRQIKNQEKKSESIQEKSSGSEAGDDESTRKERKKISNRIGKIEREIQVLAEEKKRLDTKFLNPDHPLEEINTLSKRLAAIDAEIENMELEWMEKTEVLEALGAGGQ